MKTTISDRQTIELLVNTFYEKVQQDEQISYFFTMVVPVDWKKHLPIMYDFWENVLFHTGNFEGNLMQKHLLLHQKSPLAPAHFERWLQLFTTTVDELFVGDNAEIIKQRAMSIATVMQLKISKI